MSYQKKWNEISLFISRVKSTNVDKDEGGIPKLVPSFCIKNTKTRSLCPPIDEACAFQWQYKRFVL